MRILFNALSATNVSGPYVLLGHLQQLAERLSERHQLVLLQQPGHPRIPESLHPRIDVVHAPVQTAHWRQRVLWENRHLPTLMNEQQADVLFQWSGMVVPAVKQRQWAYGMNPWAMVPAVWQGVGDRLKAMLQRQAYARAVRSADVMLYISHFMEQGYAQIAGRQPQRSVVAPIGLPEALWQATQEPVPNRKPYQLLCVSVMGNHKGLETLIRVVAHLRSHMDLPVELNFVGSWPDPVYERHIHALVRARNLQGCIHFKGFLSEPDLRHEYAQARLFCLMSQCESFGIPAVEAQAFGTPVVSSNVCAIPEVCGQGGVYRAPDDVIGVAEAIAALLQNGQMWRDYSEAAQQNANRFRWQAASQPLLDLIEQG